MRSHRFRYLRTNVGPTWSIYAALVLTGFLVGGCMVMGIYKYAYSQDPIADPESSVLPPIPAAPPTQPPPVAPLDPVAQAKRVVPLDQIRKNDRVIYDGALCQWQGWHRDLNTSVINCPGHAALQIQTGRLTPVEVRSGSTR